MPENKKNDKRMDAFSEKKVVRDIVPTGRRTIRNIHLKKGEVEVPIHRKNEEYEEEVHHPHKKKRKFSGTLATFVVIFIAIAIIGVALSLFYSNAVVTITPKSQHVDINGAYTAQSSSAKNPQLPYLPYELIVESGTQDQSVPATSGPLVQTKAKGTATLYNAQITSQKIVAGTRLSNTKGLIYRTIATVVIPAEKTTSGTKVPGSISVGIIADQAGDSYNSALSDLAGDLKVVAYQGGPKYTTVYGRAKTDLTGGFSGNKQVIAPDVQNAAVASAEASLKTALLAKLKSAIPSDTIFYPSAYVVNYTVSQPTMKSQGTASIAVQATMYGIVFKSDALIKFIAQKELDAFPSDSYAVKGLSDLSFSITSTKNFAPDKGTPVVFTLKGPITILGTFSQDQLKNDLKGISVKDSNTVFAKYEAIENAYARITPFWMRSFPTSAQKITFDIKEP